MIAIAKWDQNKVGSVRCFLSDQTVYYFLKVRDNKKIINDFHAYEFQSIQKAHKIPGVG